MGRPAGSGRSGAPSPWVAAREGRPADVAYLEGLLAAGDLDPNARDPASRRQPGATLLHASARAGRLPAVQLLLRAGAHPAARDADGATPLHLAAAQRGDGAAGLVEALLLRAGPAGAAVHEALDHQRQSPLHAAAFAGSLAAVRAILAHAGRVAAAQTAIQAPLGPEAAARAARYVDWRDRLGWTALHLAAKQGHATVVALLADEAGARLDTADARQGATPLHDAVRSGSPATVDALLARGADGDRKDGKGRTPGALAGRDRTLLRLLAGERWSAIRAEAEAEVEAERSAKPEEAEGPRAEPPGAREKEGPAAAGARRELDAWQPFGPAASAAAEISVDFDF